MIHLLGAGSIGSLLATYLRQSPISLVLRPETLVKYRQYGSKLVLNTVNGPSYSTRFDASSTTDTSLIPKLLVCTKTYQLESALNAVKHRLNADSEVLIFHNGRGVEKFTKCLPTNKISFGITNSGVKNLSKYKFEYTGHGTAFILGELPHLTNALLNGDKSMLNVIKLSKSEFEYQQNLKLAVNSVINPLTALLEVPNGCIPQTQLFTDLIKETADLLGLDRKIVHKSVVETMRLTATNRSSMLNDIHKGQTEVHAINGYIADLSPSKSINKVLTELIDMKCH